MYRLQIINIKPAIEEYIEQVFMPIQTYYHLTRNTELTHLENDVPIESETKPELVVFENKECIYCNGFYGPCFGECVCYTCHAFLYPNMAPDLDNSTLLSGPPFQVTPKKIIQWSQAQRTTWPFSRTSSAKTMFTRILGGFPSGMNQTSLQGTSRSTSLGNISANAGIKLNNKNLDTDDDDSDSGNDEPAENSYQPTTSTDNINGSNHTPAVEVEDLTQQLDKLVVPQHHVDVSIDQLPPEVLIHTFQFLDDISMWSVGQVNARWRSIMTMNTNQDYWKGFTLARWPLLNLPHDVDDWYDIYTSMMLSSCCLHCIRQMAARECGTGEESSWRKHRLRTELRTLRTDPPDGIEAKPLDPLYSHWQATIIGPEGSAYEGGTFFLYIQIPYTYPMSPPLVRFITKIFHPNISRHGDIGIDSIHSNWSLALTISKVLISIQSLLTDPVCDVCMEPEIGQLYIRDRLAFEENARIWTWRHAMHQYVPH